MKDKIQNKRRIAKAHHVWKHSSRPRSVRRAAQKWMGYVKHDIQALQEVA